MFAMWLSSYQYVKPLDRMRDRGNHSLGSWDRESGEGSARGPPQSHSHLRQAGTGGRKNITNDATNERTNGLGNWEDADGTRTRKPVSRPPLFKVTPLSTEFTLSSRGLDHQRSTLAVGRSRCVLMERDNENDLRTEPKLSISICRLKIAMQVMTFPDPFGIFHPSIRVLLFFGIP